MPRSRPLPSDWGVRRRRVLQRDGNKCVKCGTPANEVDHKKAAWRGGSDEDDNLQTLCRNHHRDKTNRDAREYREWQLEKNKRRDLAPWEAWTP